MRPLAVLVVLALLLALGAWWIGHAREIGDAGTAASAPALEAQRGAEETLESATVAAREEQRAPGTAPAVAHSSSKRIHGRVVRGKAALPVAGIEVRCWKEPAPTANDGRVITDKLGTRFILPPSERPVLQASRCASGADGEFEFADLDPGELYGLEAGSAGWVLVEPLVDLAPSEEPRTLTVQRIYAARVLATGEQGEALPGECQYLRYARIAGLGECGSFPLPDVRPESAKLPPPDLSTEGLVPAPSDRIYRFSSDCDESRLGPFKILIVSAGYERQDFEFWAYPEGFAADSTIFRLKRAELAGTLRLRQDCDCKPSFCEHLLEGRLELAPLDGQEKQLEFELTGLTREQVFSDIPAGRWHLQVHARVGGFRWEREISIGAETLALALPVRELGAIRWRLRGQGDKLASDSLPLVWRGTGGDVLTSELWMSVAMRGLPAGEHEFEIAAGKITAVDGAFASEGAAITRIRVEVVAGSTKDVLVHVP